MGAYDDFWADSGRPGNAGSEDGFRRVLQGVDIRKQKPPRERWENTLVTFTGQSGDYFCMDSTMLSKHLLMLGGVYRVY